MEDESTQLLQEAVRLLRILARPQIRELEERFKAGMLTSSKRKAMWTAMDGTRTLAEIGKLAGTSSEAVRQFVRDIEQSFPDLIEVEPALGGQQPRRRFI